MRPTTSSCRPLLAALALATTLVPAPLAADGEYLVQDLGQVRTLSQADAFAWRDHATLDGVAYLYLDDGRHGLELWRSDGTAAGTRLVHDVCPGVCGSEGAPWSGGIEVVGHRIFFTADDGVHGAELWVTDGSSAGTRLVADIAPGPASSNPVALAAGEGSLYFSRLAELPNGGIWVSDGTSGGTHPLFEDSDDPFEGSGHLLAADDFLYVEYGGLWRTDGSPEGTFELHPALFGGIIPFGTLGGPRLLPDGTLVFEGCEEDPWEQIVDCEPWRTDGTLAGTYRLADLNPGVEDSSPGGFLSVGTEVWFQAHTTHATLFRTNGTPAGTAPLPIPESVKALSSNGAAATVVGGVVFTGCDLSDSDCEPWFTDGTTAYRIADLVAGPGSSLDSSERRMTSVGDVVLFVGSTSEGERALWRTDGTAEGTELLTHFESPPAEAEYGLSPGGESVVAGGRWLLPIFRADRGLDLWSSDGSLDGTLRIGTLAEEASGTLDSIHDIQHRYRTDCAAPLRQGLVTKALNLYDPGAAHLVFSDGVPNNVELLALMDPPGFGSWEEFGTWIECAANGAEVLAKTISEVWRTMGSADSTTLLLSDLAYYDFSEPAFVRHGDALAFAGQETDAPGLQFFLVPRGTEDPASVIRLPRNLASGELISSGELLFHASGSSGLEVTDGAAAPTVLVPSELPGPVDATWADGLLFFVRDSAAEGPELWRSDGTLEGTGPARNLRPGPIGGLEPREYSYLWPPHDPRVASLGAGRVVFPGNDGTTGVELWTSDGTEEGTVVVAEIAPGPDGSWPRHLVSLGNGVVFFAAEHPTFGYELFRTDGTAAGTSVVRDLVTGVGSSVPDDFVVQDGVLYFSAWTPAHGREAWRSDGTFAGTFRLTDVAPGPLSSSPSRFVRRGNRLFFTATDHVHGFELWARADDGSVPLFIDGFETGDAGRWSAQNP